MILLASLTILNSVESAGSCDKGIERARAVMGTTARVVVCDPAQDDSASAAAVEALDAIDRVDRVMSLYRPDSDLSRLNRQGHPGPVRLDADLVELLDASRRIGLETGGKFDVTIKPLMDHYGFYRELGFLPPGGGLAGALSLVGFRRLRVDPETGSAAFEAPGMGVDLGGIAKGYALDKATAALRRRGVHRAYLDLGRNLMFVGAGSGPGGVWRAGIVDPLDPSTIAAFIEVPEGALSTSALSGRLLSGPDGTVGHILDPLRGAVEGPILQVTVWSPSATRADAFSTALILMGRKEARRMLERAGEAAVRFTRSRKSRRGCGQELLGRAGRRGPDVVVRVRH